MKMAHTFFNRRVLIPTGLLLVPVCFWLIMRAEHDSTISRTDSKRQEPRSRIGSTHSPNLPYLQRIASLEQVSAELYKPATDAFVSFGRSSFTDALELALTIRNKSLKELIIRKLCEIPIGDYDAAARFHFARGRVPENAKDWVSAELLRTIAKESAEITPKLFAHIFDTGCRQGALINIFTEVPLSKLDLLVKWAVSLTPDEQRMAATGIGHQSAALSESKFAEIASETWDGGARQQIARAFGEHLSSGRNFEDAVDRIHSLPANLRQDVLYGLLSHEVMFSRTPADLIGILNENEVGDVVKTELLPKLGGRLAQQSVSSGQNTADGANLMLALSDPVSRANALSGYLKTWLNVDSLGASEWINRLSPGSEREMATPLVVERLLVAGDYDDARIWAGQVANPELRQKYLNQLAKRGH